MDAVTYPDAAVIDALESGFSCFKLNMLDRHPDFKEASGASKVMWAPTLIFADAKGRELRRYVGWLPPASFLAELEFVHGQNAMNRADFEAARGHFQRILDDHSEAEIAAEAQYWQGISAFLGGGKDMAALQASWGDLAQKHAGQRWATHASVIEDIK